MPAEKNTTTYRKADDEITIDIRRYVMLAWHWAWLIVLVTALAAVVTYLLTSRVTPVYRASTTLLINEAPSTKTTDYTALLTSERLARTYAQVMSKRPVLEAVIEQLDLNLTPGMLKGMISIAPLRDTQLIEIHVEDTNPQRAAQVANTMVTVFSDQLQQTQTSRFAASKDSLQKQMDDLEAQIAATQEQLASSTNSDEIARFEARLNQYQQSYSNLSMSFEQVRMAEAQSLSGVVQVEEAAVPAAPIRPNKIRNTILAALIGMISVIGIIFLVDSMDDTVKDPDEIARRFHLPLMGVIAFFDKTQSSLVTLSTPRAPVSEAFRALRTNIQYAGVDKPIRTLLVTSTAPSDGKSTIISNLAIVIAQGGRKVTLMDADMHRPRLHRVFGSENSTGLSSLFVQPKVALEGYLQNSATPGLHLLPSGPIPPNPSELLGSQKMREIFEGLLETNDVVLVDSPPVLSVTDGVVLAPLMDGVLVVVRPGETHMSALAQTIDQLQRVNANVIGFVVNGINTRNGSYNYYFRNYYKRYDTDYASDSKPYFGKHILKKRKSWFV